MNDNTMLPLQLDTDIDLLEFDLPIEIPGFDLDIAPTTAAVCTDMVHIRRYPRPAPSLVRYEYAAEMAKQMPEMEENEAVFAVVSGNFIFGDFIEALMVEKNWFAEELLIATLSLGKGNVDSLRNLQQGDYVGSLGLIVSDFWYAHERRAGGGVPYIEQVLGQAENFDFAAAGIHTKITLIRTDCGKKLVLHGSANLRSSRNVEQLMCEHNPALYDFNAAWMRGLLQDFSANPKSKRGNELWMNLTEPTEPENSPTGGKDQPPQPSATPSEPK